MVGDIMKNCMTIEDKAFDIVTLVIGIFILLICLYPFYYVLVLSFNTGADARMGGIYFWPRDFTLENYQKVLADQKWLSALFITVSRTVIGTVLSVAFTSAFAYALSYKKLIGRKFYYTWLIIAMYVSGGLIPTYMVFKTLHMTNNFLVYIVPSALDYFFVLVFVSFYREIPAELRESAIVDGASELTVFLKIILRVSGPVLATFSLFAAVGQWNSYFDATIYVQNTNLKPMAKYLVEIINKSATSQLANAYGRTARYTTQSLQMATMIVSILPIAVVYPFLQKYFASGIMLGAVKG